MALRAHFDLANGLPGPQPFVAFRFVIYTDGQNPYMGLSHQILVHAAIEGSTTPIGAAYLPGSHRFERSSDGPGHQVTAVLPIELSTMRWLEQQREGRGGVTFYFDWHALGQIESPNDGPQPLQNEVVSLAVGSTPFPVSLPQEVWIDILHEVRYREVAIVEVPLVADEQNPMARAHEHLETARDRLYRADDRGVLVACGEALDVLPNARRVKLSKEYGYEHLVQDLVAPIFDSERKAERLGRLLTGLRQMCLSGKHDEATFDGRPIPVDHRDAMLAFLATSAAISYLEQLPLEARLRMPSRGVSGSGGSTGEGTPARRRRSRRSRPAGADGAQAETAPPQPPSAVTPAAEPESVGAVSSEGTPPAARRRRWRLPRPRTGPDASPTA